MKRLILSAILVLILLPAVGIQAGGPILKSTTEYIKDLSTGKTLNVTKPVLKSNIPVEIFVELVPNVPDVSLISQYLYIKSTTSLKDARWIITFFFRDGTYKEKRFSGKVAKTWDSSLHNALKIQVKVSGRTPEPIVSSIEPYTGLEVNGVARKEVTLLNISLYKGEPGLIFGGKYQYTVHTTFAVITSDAIETALSQIKESENKIPADANLTVVFNKLHEMASKGHPGWAAEIARALSDVPLFKKTREYCNTTVCAPMVTDLKGQVSSLTQKVESLSDENSKLKGTIKDLQKQLESTKSSVIPTAILSGVIAFFIGAGAGISLGKRSGASERELLKEKVQRAMEIAGELKTQMGELQLNISKLFEAPSTVKEKIRPTIDALYKANSEAKSKLDELVATLQSEV